MLVHTQVCAATAETGEHRREIGSDRSARRALALDVHPRPQLTQHTDSRSQRRRRREAQGRGGLRLRHCIRLPPLLRVWIAACPITSPAPHTPPTSPPCTPSHSSAHLRADLLLDLRGVLLSALHNKFWFFNLWLSWDMSQNLRSPDISYRMLRQACRLQSRGRGLSTPLRGLGAPRGFLSGALSQSRRSLSDAAAPSTSPPGTSPTAPTSPPASPPLLVEKLRELESLPWWQSGFLRLVGTFSNSQWQKAAGNDLRQLCVAQAAQPVFYDPCAAAVDNSRWFTRFQANSPRSHSSRPRALFSRALFSRALFSPPLVLSQRLFLHIAHPRRVFVLLDFDGRPLLHFFANSPPILPPILPPRVHNRNFLRVSRFSEFAPTFVSSLVLTCFPTFSFWTSSSKGSTAGSAT